MSDAIRIELNIPGLIQLRKSEGIKAALKQEADAIAGAAGNCTVTEGDFPERARAYVRQKMTEQDMEDNTLLKAVHFQ